MKKIQMKILAGLMLLLIGGITLHSAPAGATEFMKLKDAIKHFMPAGSKPFKVTKTVPDSEYAKLKKRFRLEDKPEFKDAFKKGPYTIYITRDASNNPTMYIMILEQYWKTCYHKFAVGVTPDGTVQEAIILELNCKLAYPVNKKSFLKQFKGKKAQKGKKPKVELGQDIDAVSGATMSSQVSAIVVRRALALYEAFFAS